MKFNEKYIPWIKEGRKTCTTRLDKKAEIGEIIQVGDVRIQIVRIIERKFHDALFCFDAEGYEFIHDYKEDVRAIYPGITEDTIVFCHFFKVIR